MAIVIAISAIVISFVQSSSKNDELLSKQVKIQIDQKQLLEELVKNQNLPNTSPKN